MLPQHFCWASLLGGFGEGVGRQGQRKRKESASTWEKRRDRKSLGMAGSRKGAVVGRSTTVLEGKASHRRGGALSNRMGEGPSSDQGEAPLSRA